MNLPSLSHKVKHPKMNHKDQYDTYEKNDTRMVLSEIAFEKRGPSVKEYTRQPNKDDHLRVTFELDENHQVRTLVAEAASPSRTASSHLQRKLWWTRAELVRIWAREQKVCDFYRHGEDDYADQIRRIFSRCSQSSKKILKRQPSHRQRQQQTQQQQPVLLLQASFSSLASSSSSSFCVSHHNPKKDAPLPGASPSLDAQFQHDAHVLAARSSNRGLELRVVNVLEVHRRKAIRGILAIQQKVQHLAPTQRQHMIRSKSQFLSRPARNFARIMAHADAMVAEATLLEDKDMITLEQFSTSCRQLMTLSGYEEESFRLDDSQTIHCSNLNNSGTTNWGESFRCLGDSFRVVTWLTSPIF